MSVPPALNVALKERDLLPQGSSLKSASEKTMRVFTMPKSLEVTVLLSVNKT